MITMMIMMIIMIMMIVLLLCNTTSSYNTRMTKRISRNVIRMVMPSYKDAFNKAKNPQNNINTNTNSNSNNSSNNNKKTTVEVKKQPQVITRNDDDLDDLPFTDEMYDHLKYVIGTLTARMKSEKPLTESELKRFKGSIDAIILDSKEDSYQNDTYDNSDDSNSFYNENEDDSINYEPEEASNTNTNTNTLKASAATTETIGNNPFSQFRGSTWNFDNMEDMSTEEYYDALNERLAAMKKKKLEVYERDELNNPSESYFENLSRKNRV